MTMLMRLGQDDVLLKPFKSIALMALIREQMEKLGSCQHGSELLTM